MKQIFTIILIIIGVINSSVACSCGPTESTNVEDYNKIDVLFTGRILKIEEDIINYKLTMSVDIAIKNCKSRDTIVVYTCQREGCCGLYVKEGQYWSIWGYEKNSGTYSAGTCGRSQRVNKSNLPNYIDYLKRIAEFTGTDVWRYENDSIGASGSMLNGVPDGYWKYYHKDGSTKESGTYKLGLRTGKWEYYKKAQGMLISKNDTTLIDKDRIERILNDTAFLKFELTSVDSSIVHLKRTAEFKEGKYHGEVCYFKDGILNECRYYFEGKETHPNKE